MSIIFKVIADETRKENFEASCKRIAEKNPKENHHHQNSLTKKLFQGVLQGVFKQMNEKYFT